MPYPNRQPDLDAVPHGGVPWKAVLFLAALAVVAPACAVDAEGLAEGRQAEPILGGTLDYNAPTVVRILKDGQSWCSGTWVGNRTILTAAHCFDATASHFTVEFVVNVGTATSPVVSRTTYAVASVTPHPTWSTQNGSGVDLGILRLATSVANPYPVPSPSVSPPPFNPTAISALPIEAVVPAAPAYELPETQFTIVGFGRTSTSATTSDGLRYAASTVSNRRSETHIELDCRTGACTYFGDSGGPAVTTYEGEQLVSGVTSGGKIACGDPFMGYDVRVDLPANAAWILSAAGGDVRFYAPRLVAKDVTGLTVVSGAVSGTLHVESQPATGWGSSRELFTYSSTGASNNYAGRVLDGGLVLVLPPGSSTTATTLELQLVASNGTAFVRRVYVPAIAASTRTVSLVVGIDGSTFWADAEHDGWAAAYERLAQRVALHPSHVALRAPAGVEGTELPIPVCGFVCGSGYPAGIGNCN